MSPRCAGRRRRHAGPARSPGRSRTGPPPRPAGRRTDRLRRRGPRPWLRRTARPIGGLPRAMPLRRPCGPARRHRAKSGRPAHRRRPAPPPGGAGPSAHHEAGADIGQASRRPPTRRHRDHRLGRIRPSHNLELGGARPQDPECTCAGHGRAGDRALVDVLHAVGTVASEAHRAPAVHRHAHRVGTPGPRCPLGPPPPPRPSPARPGVPTARQCGRP